MDLHHATLETCPTATATVVVIDVIRAFTVAAFAFAAGARDLIPVSTVEEALVLRQRFPGALVMGEVGGLPPQSFDLGNSPAALIGRDLQGKRLIQRTSAGTQGLVRSVRATTLLASSVVCAGATVQYLKRQSPPRVTLVSTGPTGEDEACAAYMMALLRDETPDGDMLVDRVRQIGLRRLRGAVSQDRLSEAAATKFTQDLECCTTLDRFDFTMCVRRQDDVLVMEPVW